MNIKLCDISVQYCSNLVERTRALNRISLSFRSGEICGIAGPAGSGKTTLIQLMNGLLHPSSGRVLVDNIDMREKQVERSIRRRVGLVFQFPENQLFEETVSEDIAFGLKNMGISDDERAERVRRAMDLVGLHPGFADRSPFELSGGEKRRTAIAGILSMEPEILVLDEPTVGLDYSGTLSVEKIIREYHQKGRGVVFISHDMDLIARLADRIIVLGSGEIKYNGDRETLFGDQSLLQSLGLERPRIKAFMRKLSEEGWSVRTDIYRLDDAKREINRMIQKKKQPAK